MRKPFVVGNWKMNGSADTTTALAKEVVERFDPPLSIDVALCPPSVFLHLISNHLQDSPIALGAQDVSEHSSGAYTGEIAASMLAETGCRYVIIGHSERRKYFGDSNARIQAKFIKALEFDLIPIVCIGETLEERESELTEEVLDQQLDVLLQIETGVALSYAVLAYEPVWAIGTGNTATPEQAQEVHRFIRDRIFQKNAAVSQEIRILYGGSVKPNNASSLFSMQDIDGGLIGGASLEASQFVDICRAAI